MVMKKASAGKRIPWVDLPSLPPGDYTAIRIPVPPTSAMNKDRPISSLIQAQLEHIHHAESARLPKEKRDGRHPKDIRKEAEAASYIAAVTGILHPQRRKKSSKELGG